MASKSTTQAKDSAEKRTGRPPLGEGSSTSRIRSKLVTSVKYCNTLPDLPFDPKFIPYPFGVNRFLAYSTTSLERNYSSELLTEPDVGVDVELVIPNTYRSAPDAPVPSPINPVDEQLLDDDSASQKGNIRSRHHAQRVSWLRRTEYISTERTKFQPQTMDKVEAKVGFSIKKTKNEDPNRWEDRKSQVNSIEGTFKESLTPIESHFAKPGVYPVEVLPLFPDFQLWKHSCAQVIFDSDPAPVGKSVAAQMEEMSQAMIRGVMDGSGEQFVAYFLPTEETLGMRKKDLENGTDYEDDAVYEYRMAREYNWNVKSKATRGAEDNYFFVFRDDGVYYNELETKVRLIKRRVCGPTQELNTKMYVKHIPLEAADFKVQRKREKQLEPLFEEDEDEAVEVEEDKSANGASEETEKSSSDEDDE